MTTNRPFVPDDLAVPRELVTPRFRLEPLGPEHNDADLAAWTSSTVIEPAGGEVIGCVYIYPSRTSDADTVVRSWVRADRAELDRPLHEAVAHWLRTDWPLGRISSPGR